MADPKAVQFDPIASPAISQFHAPATRDAIAYVAQFQVLKKLCGGIRQLSQGCLPSKTALDSVNEAIGLGGSISWLDAFEKLTGSRQLGKRGNKQIKQIYMIFLKMPVPCLNTMNHCWNGSKTPTIMSNG
jgi:hypothetical protein